MVAIRFDHLFCLSLTIFGISVSRVRCVLDEGRFGVEAQAEQEQDVAVMVDDGRRPLRERTAAAVGGKTAGVVEDGRPLPPSSVEVSNLIVAQVIRSIYPPKCANDLTYISPLRRSFAHRIWAKCGSFF